MNSLKEEVVNILENYRFLKTMIEEETSFYQTQRTSKDIISFMPTGSKGNSEQEAYLLSLEVAQHKIMIVSRKLRLIDRAVLAVSRQNQKLADVLELRYTGDVKHTIETTAGFLDIEVRTVSRRTDNAVELICRYIKEVDGFVFRNIEKPNEIQLSAV